MLINECSWGVINTNDDKIYKDVRIFTDKTEKWDWGTTGTRHDPGIQIADVEDMLNSDVSYCVLSCGMQGVLKIKQETLDFLTQKNIKIYKDLTPEAIKIFNELSTKFPNKVIGLFHSTC